MVKKAAIIADTHFGVRGDSDLFLADAEKFITETFIPYLDKHSIKLIIHLGDLFDKRTKITLTTLDRVKAFFFDALKKRDIEVHLIIGNHDTPYRDTNFPNSPELLINEEYDNVHIYPSVDELSFWGKRILFVPWINNENREATNTAILNSTAEYMMGHLEIQGFQMIRGYKCEHGFTKKQLSKFEMVLSGHFHHRSYEGNVWYVGNPYETTWNDAFNLKGFHIMNFDPQEDEEVLEFVPNPEKMFYNFFYDGTMIEDLDTLNLKGKYVRIDVSEKPSPADYDLFKEKIEKQMPFDLKVVDRREFKATYTEEETEALKSKSNIEVILEYVDELESLSDKEILKTYLRELYQKAEQLVE